MRPLIQKYQRPSPANVQMGIDTYLKSVLSGSPRIPKMRALLPPPWLAAAATNADATRTRRNSPCHSSPDPNFACARFINGSVSVVLTCRRPLGRSTASRFPGGGVLTKHNNVHVYGRVFCAVCASIRNMAYHTHSPLAPTVRVFLFRPYLHHPPLCPRAKQTISILGAAYLMCLLAVVTGVYTSPRPRLGHMSGGGGAGPRRRPEVA